MEAHVIELAHGYVGAYGSEATARVEIARCAACGQDGPVLTMGMAEDEYGAVSLCEPCILEGFARAKAPRD